MISNREINNLSDLHSEIMKLNVTGSIKHKMLVLTDRTQQSLIERSAGFMPEVYKDWIKSLGNLTQDESLAYFHNIIFYPDEINSTESWLLYEWLLEDGSKSSFMFKVSECIEAICYGYEVKGFEEE